jgi:cysteine desulfurase
MTISAHKVGGPLGIGALVLRKAFEMPALLHGGGQEREIRSGTLNAPSIVAFAAAVRENTYSAERVESLRHSFESGINKVAPLAEINGIDAPRLPGIVNVTFPGTQADFLLLLMDGKKVSCSTGAACTAGVHRPSHVLMAMGRDEIGATSSLRFSLGANTTDEDIEYTLSVIPEVIEMAKAANSL